MTVKLSDILEARELLKGIITPTPMIEDGRAKVLAGWTTPAEVLKAVYTQAIE